VAQGGDVCAGMGVGMLGAKQVKRRPIWSPGMASRAGRRSARESPGVPEGLGRQVFRIPVFQKVDIENFSGVDRLVPSLCETNLLGNLVVNCG